MRVAIISACIWIVLMAGCTHSAGVKAPARPAAAKSPSQLYDSLEPLRTIDLSKMTDAISEIRPSPDGSKLAVRLWASSDSYNSQVHIFETGTGQETHSYESPHGSIVSIAWHPKDPVLAYYTATGEPLPPDMLIDRGFGTYDLRTKKAKYFRHDSLNEQERVDWLPDGKRLISNSWIIDASKGTYNRRTPSQIADDYYARRITVSRSWVCAVEHAEESSVIVVRLNAANSAKVKKSGRFTVSPKHSGHKLVSYSILPQFQSNGRLAFVRIADDLEIRTCREDGSDVRPWIKLPPLKPAEDGWSPVAPVGWSADGKIVAYADGNTVKVFRVVKKS